MAMMMRMCEHLRPPARTRGGRRKKTISKASRVIGLHRRLAHAHTGTHTHTHTHTQTHTQTVITHAQEPEGLLQKALICLPLPAHPFFPVVLRCESHQQLHLTAGRRNRQGQRSYSTFRNLGPRVPETPDDRSASIAAAGRYAPAFAPFPRETAASDRRGRVTAPFGTPALP